MKKSLTLGTTATEEKDIRAEFQSSSNLRARLVKILQEKREYNINQKVSDTSYDSPNWAYKQADLAGYIRALEEISDLLK